MATTFENRDSTQSGSSMLTGDSTSDSRAAPSS